MANHNQHNQHMHCIDSVIEHSMKNGLQINLKDAIEDAGVKVPESICLWQYPEVIRKNLIAKTINNINIKGKDIINIQAASDDSDLVYEISTNIDTSNIDRPNYAGENSEWGSNLTALDIIADLFSNILPNVRGIYSGDISVSDPDGIDTQEWKNLLFNKSGIKTGLEPNCRYIRLYLTCQAEPIFINTGNVVKDLTGGYNIVNSETVTYELNETNMTLTSNVNVVSIEDIDNLN